MRKPIPGAAPRAKERPHATSCHLEAYIGHLGQISWDPRTTEHKNCHRTLQAASCKTRTSLRQILTMTLCQLSYEGHTSQNGPATFRILLAQSHPAGRSQSYAAHCERTKLGNNTHAHTHTNLACSVARSHWGSGGGRLEPCKRPWVALLRQSPNLRKVSDVIRKPTLNTVLAKRRDNYAETQESHSLLRGGCGGLMNHTSPAPAHRAIWAARGVHDPAPWRRESRGANTPCGARTRDLWLVRQSAQGSFAHLFRVLR